MKILFNFNQTKFYLSYNLLTFASELLRRTMNFVSISQQQSYATFTGRLHPPHIARVQVESQQLCFSVLFSIILFQFLSRRSHRRYLLTGEGLKSLCYQMRVRPNHLLPAPGLHHVCHVTCIYELNRLKIVKSFVTRLPN